MGVVLAKAARCLRGFASRLPDSIPRTPSTSSTSPTRRQLRGAVAAALAVIGLAAPAAAQELPRLKRRGEVTQLLVEGQPFLILGGELGNSTPSDIQRLHESLEKLQAMNLNTVLSPVSWELVEPEEGRFNFASVDDLLREAREHELRVVLLWFGTWKNSMSSYAPAWVKRDTKRFARTIGADGRPQEIISAFSREARDADARAFAALMRHLREVDGEYHTVLMVQVENEVGFLPFAKEDGTGPDLVADERAMATAYARYVEAVAAAGKREYPLPMFVNGAQGRPGAAPGDYPSGGPLAHLADVWRREAPSVDFIAPDIYFPNFAEIAGHYVESGNPLFVPEANRASDPRVAANALYSFGRLGAIGFSPFAIEDASDGEAKRIGALYAMLASIAPDVLRAQAEGRIDGFAEDVTFADVADNTPVVAELGPALVTATTIDPWTARAAQDTSTHGALLLWFGGNHYLAAGQGVTFTFAPADGKGRFGFEWVEEGGYVDGLWEPGRRLNGDQTHQGRHVRLPPGDPGIQLIQLYRY